MSKGQFFDQYLKFIRLNDVPVEFGDSDVESLVKSNYDPVFHNEVYQIAVKVREACAHGPFCGYQNFFFAIVTVRFSPRQISLDSLLSQDLDPRQTYRVEYNYANQPDFSRTAKKLGIMDDWKVGGWMGRGDRPLPQDVA